MQVPKPTPEHRRLEALAGEWTGEETLHPSPWEPESRTATGRFSNRVGVDGMFLINDYEEESDGQIVFRGHGVYGWDPARARYTMLWFDSMGASPRENLGVWEGDTLTFTGHGEQGSARYIYTVHDPDRFAFRIEASRDGVSWTPIMEGDYTRNPP